MNAPAKPTPSSQISPKVSLTEQSNSTLAAAVRGNDTAETQAAILQRAHICLASYYDPDLDPEVKAQVRGAFVRALIDLPLWAVKEAFDNWEKTGRNRPSPANIRLLAEAALRPITDELARRKRIRDEQEAEERQRQAARIDPEAAARILAAAGFTPRRLDAIRAAPMAGSFDEAEERASAPPAPHWSDIAPEDAPERRALEAARAANPLVAAARASAARRAPPQDVQT